MYRQAKPLLRTPYDQQASTSPSFGAADSYVEGIGIHPVITPAQQGEAGPNMSPEQV